MASIAETRVKPAHGERRFVIHNVGWDGYQTLLRVLDDHPGVRLTYDRGNIELMSPLHIHERYSNLLGYMIEAITDELEIPRIGGGSTTFNAELLDRGLEPDECYHLASAAKLRREARFDLAVDPPPDLAFEVELTTSALSRLGILAALGIPEVWRFDGESLTVHRLGPDGCYATSESSGSFPFLPMGEIERFLSEHDANDDGRWGRGFREWVRTELRSRYDDWQRTACERISSRSGQSPAH